MIEQNVCSTHMTHVHIFRNHLSIIQANRKAGQRIDRHVQINYGETSINESPFEVGVPQHHLALPDRALKNEAPRNLRPDRRLPCRRLGNKKNLISAIQ